MSGIGRVTPTVVLSPTATSAPLPVVTPDSSTIYYQTLFAALSTFGLFNTLIGIAVVGIIGFNAFAFVAITNSAAAAMSYGLGWAAYHSTYDTRTKVICSIIADFFWLIQEGSLSVYSFLLVRKMVRDRERVIYLAVFFFLEFCIFAFRVPIMVSRVFAAYADTPLLEMRIRRYHTAYFISIALCETWNAYFLLKKFYKVDGCRRGGPNPGIGGLDPSGFNTSSDLPKRRQSVFNSLGFRKDLYSQLARSSEVRLASLASIGIIRAITISFSTAPVPQMDNFVACCETMFSTVFLVDIFVTRLAFLEQKNRNTERFEPTTGRSAKSNFKNHSTDVTINCVIPDHPVSAGYGLSDMKQDVGTVMMVAKPIATCNVLATVDDSKGDELSDYRQGSSRFDMV